MVTAGFCHHCGAKIVHERLSFKSLFNDFWFAITNVERGLWATMRDLIFRPGDVILGYLGGLRKKYTAPASYALIIGAIYSVIALVYPEVYIHEEILEGVLMGQDQRPGWATDARKVLIPLRLLLLFAPVFTIAYVNYLAYRKQGNGAEHTVISLYYFAQACILYLLLILLFDGVQQFTGPNNAVTFIGLSLFLISTLVYKSMVYRACYQHRSRWQATWKPVFLFFVGFILNMIPYFLLMAVFLREIE